MAELPLPIGQFQWEKRSRRPEEHRHCPGWASRVDTEGGPWAACKQEGFKKEPGIPGQGGRMLTRTNLAQGSDHSGRALAASSTGRPLRGLWSGPTQPEHQSGQRQEKSLSTTGETSSFWNWPRAGVAKLKPVDLFWLTAWVVNKVSVEYSHAVSNFWCIVHGYFHA